MAPKSYPAGTSLSANYGREWTKETGEVQTLTMDGNTAEVEAQYAIIKALATAYGVTNLASMGVESNAGRARLIQRFVRENKDVEELYAVDVIQDVRVAPYFETLTDTEITDVKHFYDNPTYPATAIPSGWSTLQKTLFAHLYHGAESYKSKQFILRTSKIVSLATLVEADLSNIEKVVPLPTLSSDMTRLIKTLPDGEWLQGPMQVEHLGKGRFRLDNELEWAKKWSVIYGGTLFAPP